MNKNNTTPLRIAQAQMNPTLGDLDGNYKKIVHFIRRAQNVHADIVIFPELAITGYPPEDLLFKRSFVTDNLKILKELAVQVKTGLVITGFVDRGPGGSLYNAAACLFGGKLRGVYHKRDLPNYGVFDEKRYFQSGDRNLIISTPLGRLGLSICEDIWNPKGPAFKEACTGGAELLINISASPYHAGKQTQRRRMLSARARQSRSFVVYTNLVGGQDELVFDGGSLVMNSKGGLVSQACLFEEDLLVTDIILRQLKKPSRAQSQTPFDTISVPLLPRLPKGKLPVKKEFLRSKTEEIYEALLLGVRDYVRKNRFSQVLVGLSGGIDSALVAQIAVDALGARNVKALTMPSSYTSTGTFKDALTLAKNLRIDIQVVSIAEILKVYLKHLPTLTRACGTSLTEENLQARIRGTLLMALSNELGHLVLTTGNKSEIATGYCTLYGDMAGGFAVIKDVPKIIVYQLAQLRTVQKGGGIPLSILKRAPTAELRPHQKDSDSLPVYKTLDPILEAYVEKDLDPDKIVRKGFSKEIVKKVVRLVDKSEYKRRQGPPGIKITPRAFGKDRRMPITHQYFK